MPEAPLLRRVLRRHWSDRTGNIIKIVIGGEMVFHRLEIISKATNVAEIKDKVLEEVSRHHYH